MAVTLPRVEHVCAELFGFGLSGTLVRLLILVIAWNLTHISTSAYQLDLL